MNKDQFISAMKKIEASDNYKKQVGKHMEEYKSKEEKPRYIRWIPIFAAGIAAIVFGVFIFPSLRHNNVQPDSKDFIITGKMQGEASYISILYMYGYAYTPCTYYSYSGGYQDKGDKYVAEEKLGEVTLDLKDLSYTGTPPDFSSTCDKGTKIYKIKNVKKERAVIVRENDEDWVYYRQYKVRGKQSEPIGLTMNEVFQMITDRTEVTSVDLLSDVDGSWMMSSNNKDLITLINRELPGKPLRTQEEIGKDVGDYGTPVNLIFKDGSKLNIRFNTYDQVAIVFGGYITISKEISEKINQLVSEGSKYSKLTDLFPDVRRPNYLYRKDYVSGKKGICDDPEGTGGSLYYMINGYRVEKTEKSNATQHVMKVKIGSSNTNYTELDFYYDNKKNIIIRIKGEYYKTVKSYMSYQDLKKYLD